MSGGGVPHASMNAGEVLHMKVSDVLHMEVSEFLRTDLGKWRVRRIGPLPKPEIMKFEAEPNAAADARAFARAALDEWAKADLGDEAPIDEALKVKAAFVVSEFVTRCLDQGSGGTLFVRCTYDGIHVEVTADDADFHDSDRASLGVRVIEGASASWGVLYTWPHFRSLWSDITA